MVGIEGLAALENRKRSALLGLVVHGIHIEIPHEFLWGFESVGVADDRDEHRRR